MSDFYVSCALDEDLCEFEAENKTGLMKLFLHSTVPFSIQTFSFQDQLEVIGCSYMVGMRSMAEAESACCDEMRESFKKLLRAYEEEEDKKEFRSRVAKTIVDSAYAAYLYRVRPLM